MSEDTAPVGWHRKNLLSLADYHNGAAFAPRDWGTEGLPIVRIEQINDPNAPTDFYSGPLLPHNRIDSGNLIFSWSATLKAMIWRHGQAALNQHLFKVIPKSENDLVFLKHVLDGNMDRISSGSHGSTMKHITRRELERFHVHVPEQITEQCRIAEILTTLDETIEQTEVLIAKYQQIKAGLMHDLFTCGVTPDGRLRPTRDQAPHLYKESPRGWIPKEWEPANIRSLTSLCIDCPHTTPVLSGDGYLMARTSEIRNGKFYVEQSPRVPPVEYRSRVSRGAPSEGDIIFTREAPVGEAFVVPANLEICLGQRVMLMRPLRNRCDSIFLLFQIYSDRVQREFSRITGGTTNPHFNVDDVRKFIVSLPNPSEQVEIAKRLTVAADFINSEEAKVDKLRHQKFGLMQDLLTGRVRVAI